MSGAWRWALFAIAAAGLAAALLPMLYAWSDLPDPLAVHWSAEREPDGAMSKSAALWPPAAIIAAVLLLTLINSGRAFANGRASRAAIVAFGSAIAAATSSAIVALNFGRADWSQAGSLTPAILGLVLGAAVALAALAYVIGAHVWRNVQPPPAASGAAGPLSPGMPTSWTSSASNRWLIAIGAYLLAQAFVLQALLPPLRDLWLWLPVHAVVFVALELFSRLVVTIDERGVTMRYGHLGLWTRRVPLGEIATAGAVTLDALEHGGWGYRGSLRLFGKASLVVRSGPALKLALASGRTLFVTVDDAATGASLINALRGRTSARGAAAPGITPSS